MAESVKFGAFVPQGWRMELAGVDPREGWDACRDFATEAERAGFDSIWVYDHFHTVPKASSEPTFECWTTMAALAEATGRIRLGQMVGCMSYRNPGLLAKITSNVDVISGGRLEWGIGAGWYQHEYRGYGYEFLPAAARIRALREGVEIVKSMWTSEKTDYAGKVFDLEGGRCFPKPVQKPHPPVWIGGGGEKLTLRVVARHADWSNFGGKPHEWARKVEILKSHCQAVGRDFETIGMSINQDCFLGESEDEVDAWLASPRGGSMWGEAPDSYRKGQLIGTAEQISERIREYVALGCRYFVLFFRDLPSTTMMRRFAEEVMPEFRSETRK